MMAIKFVLLISIILQFGAAILALRLIRITHHISSWVLIASAIALMGIRRSITFGRVLSEHIHISPDPAAELVALAISILMIVGIWRITPYFRAMKKSRELIEASEKRYRNTLDHMLEGGQIIGYDWRYLYLNDMAVKHAKKSKDELIGQTMMEVYPGIEETDMFSTLKHCMEERVAHRMENEFVYPDGSKGWFELSTQPVPEGIFILTLDITKRKINQMKLVQALETAREADRVKTLFLANISHEIRTPLNGIVGYVDLIESQVKTKLNAEEQSYFKIIRDCNERLLKTVHEILDMSQLEAKDLILKPESLDLVELTQSLIPIFKREAIKKNLDFEFRSSEASLMVHADKYCVEQALSNLMDNAVKYTSEGRIAVSITTSDEQGILMIQDTGIGMSEEYQEHLFEQFSQESTGFNKTYQGLGLGLALTKRYLDVNNISIDVDSKKGQGTRFILTFPPIEKLDD